MRTDRKPDITLHFAPRTRSFVALWLLEELGVPYTLESFDLGGGRPTTAEFRALNPLGKVPLVIDHGRPISETGAIALYLGDLYGAPAAVPAVDDPDRPAYLRWMFFVGNVMEPAFCQKMFGWEVAPSTAGWGSYARMFEALTAGVTGDGWLLGERFTLADVIVGNYIRFGLQFQMLDVDPRLERYAARATARPSFARAMAIEEREGARFPPAAA